MKLYHYKLDGYHYLCVAASLHGARTVLTGESAAGNPSAPPDHANRIRNEEPYFVANTLYPIVIQPKS
jgi:hypothetical protein